MRPTTAALSISHNSDSFETYIDGAYSLIEAALAKISSKMSDRKRWQRREVRQYFGTDAQSDDNRS
jgi:hypothetical protein